jgi:ParB family chromosome partitioning protein
MNTMTHEETFALEAAIPAQAMLLVPLSQLRPSARNVRKTSGTSITELAASIQRAGLLQNLTVILAADGVHYDVVAGRRRLTALKLLAKKRRIDKEYQVPCLLVANAAARTASLTENVQREAMHPADQFEAFAALIDEGRSIEDIAADFGVTPLVVQRRLKLANVSPRLMADYRTDDVTLDQLMALAITDDHAAQEGAFYDAPHWQRSATALRERLTEREIDAYRHPLARFVGLDAYAAAGGGIRRDLFADDDKGIYLTDAALLDRLAQAKLSMLAEELRGEGWGWVEAVSHTTQADLQTFQRAPRETRKPTVREAKRIAKLEAKMQAVAEAMDAALEVEDEDKADALNEEGERLGEQLEDLNTALLVYSPAVRDAAGAVVTLDREGEAIIHRGLLREAEAKALQALAKARYGDSAGDEEGTPVEQKASQSEKLTQRLSAHRTAALQVELARHPQVALAALVQGMVHRMMQSGYGFGLPMGIILNPQDKLDSYAPEMPQTSAGIAMQGLQEAWSHRLPEEGDALFAALLAMPQSELVALLAVCVARTVDGVTRREDQDPSALLAQAVGLDMRAWWTPTAEGYFSHVSKAVLLQAVQQFAPQHAHRLSKLKKTQIASEAELLVVGTGWMPAMFSGQETVAQATDDVPDVPQDDDTVEVEADAAVALIA